MRVSSAKLCPSFYYVYNWLYCMGYLCLFIPNVVHYRNVIPVITGTYVCRIPDRRPRMLHLHRDGSKSFFASPSQVTSHFLASPSPVTSHLVRRQVKSSHKSFGQTSSQVKSQVIWSKHKSSHKSLCASTSQVAHYFVQL